MNDFIPHILIVDDEPLNRDIIQRSLEDEGYEFSEAGDGDIALEMLNATPDKFDILLLDRMMPNVNGFEVLKTMKQNPLLTNIPVILQTARSTKDDIKEGIDEGAYFYLTKPFEEDILLSMVRSAILQRNKYLQFKNELDHGASSLSMMEQGHFKFRTLYEAKSLSMFLAKTCPIPEKVSLGLSELFLNAVEHGNLGITYDEKTLLNTENRWIEEVERRLSLAENRNKYVEVIFERFDKNISIKISDQGNGFNWSEYLEFNSDRVFDNHGRGIASSYTMNLDDLVYNQSGNEVTAIILLNEESAKLEDCA